MTTTTFASADSNPPVSKKARWAGYILSALPCLLFLYSSVGIKFFQPPGIEEHFTALGWSMDTIVVMGVLELTCTIIYLVPRTSVLGAILLTGYLGGAIAAHVRIGENVVFQVVLGVFLWLGLYLRHPRLRALLPLVSGRP